MRYLTILLLAQTLFAQDIQQSPSANGLVVINNQGNGTKVQRSTGSTTTGHCVQFDASGNTVDAGAACGSGGGGSITVGVGAIASLPTCTNVLNEMYYPTDSYYSMITCLTGASSWTYLADGKQLFPPTAANTWTVVNGASGTATASNSHGATILSTTSDVLGIESMLKAVPATPYTKTLVLRSMYQLGATPGSNEIAFCGPALTNGTTTSSAIEIARMQSQNQGVVTSLVAVSYTSYVYAGGVLQAGASAPSANISPNLWFQIADNGTTRTIKASNDGENYTLLVSQASTSPFAPTNYGVACGHQNAGGGQPFIATLLSDN